MLLYTIINILNSRNKELEMGCCSSLDNKTQ